MKEQLISWYLEWVNDYISTARFADAYGITEEQATTLIRLGRELHHSPPA